LGSTRDRTIMKGRSVKADFSSEYEKRPRDLDYVSDYNSSHRGLIEQAAFVALPVIFMIIEHVGVSLNSSHDSRLAPRDVHRDLSCISVNPSGTSRARARALVRLFSRLIISRQIAHGASANV